MAYISKLTLKNFLSFKEEQELNFDSKVNIICGRNGSGKSNIYTAFCHIFTDIYDKQSILERTRTLFDSAKYGNEALIAVEVIGKVKETDNNNIFVIKKIITPHKQVLYFNDDIVTRKDLTIMLQSLGFQCINKYIILRQGEVVTAKDFNQNGLLKILLQFFEIDESVVWEGKCKNAITTCKKKVENIRNVVDSKQQLYSDYNNKVKDYKRISSLETLKNALTKKIRLSKYEDYTTDVARVRCMIKDYENEHERFSEEKNVISKNSFLTAQNISECCSKLKDIREKISHNNEEIYKKTEELREKKLSFNGIKSELEEISTKKSKIRNQINQVTSELDTARNTYASLQREIGEAEVTEKDELSSRILSISQDLVEKKKFQGLLENGSPRKTIELIDLEIQKFDNFLQEEKMKINELNNKHSQMRENIQEFEKKIESAKSEISTYDDAYNTTKASFDELLAEKSRILLGIGKTKDALSDGISIQSPIDEYYNKQKCYGLKAIEEYFNYRNFYDVKNMNYSQYSDIYFGSLCDVFKCNDELAKKYVELAAPKSTLLGVVVNSVCETKTIQEILAKVSCKKKINLYPLEKFKDFQVRRIDEPNVKSLIDVLTFDEKFRNLIISIFGSWYITDNIRTAHRINLKYKVNCITHDFSVHRNNGQITCGISKETSNVIDVRQKFLEDQFNYKEKLIQIEKLQSALAVQNHKLVEKNEEINLLQSKLESVRNEKKTCDSNLLLNETKLNDLKNSIIYVEKEIKNSSNYIDELSSKIEKLNNFRNTQMDSQTRKKISKEISDLEESLKALNKKMNALIKKNSNLLKLREQEKQVEFLEKQHETYTKSLDDDLGEDRLLQLKDQLQQCISNYQNDIKRLKEIGENFNDTVNELELRCKELNEEKDNLSSYLKNIHNKIDVILGKIEDLQYQLDKYQGYGETLSQYQLTVAEERAFHDYKHFSIKDLMEEYEKINSRCEFVSGVKNEDIEEMEEYISDYDYIVEQSISVSDKFEETANYADILITGKNPSTLFKRFFPDGEVRFQLTLKKSIPLDKLTLKDIKGIQIRVKTSGDGSYIECGFSGGQRNVIVLCLIIACHNYFSCPFMCFDEIEADLDTAFRASFVEIIKYLNYNNQIFLTTFREETTKIGGTFYQISATENGSIASRINKDEALALIER
ncbi:RecF/RecN/SMC, N-terminal domain and SMCs flexible hinge domain and P-loop containing nucleoside triphosphate hydrolase domain-containing protein [Strongyloides ratti]|uniref:RecF/RecN/SMC, N-terminal domain and SMCs flexible hinge domain and P-loop containing nucleoside triphosphate hydrolase domain-containing protein n=1 Tax=Strongyloides ratti TaxID=34506 RepID=A0A090LBI9_STRRB|nr:RecF/RecN/SMC, N-terminal domain and SMCs flexible hinge domain and P-loop containing nucleoside triphosphate hydrolase domain-containing protein [Strongyloides ratti]CEF64890.1 RecF/RecN/SMC, N-terminal domain and SMCs flexible hinge domain and P-loop containing nucleoside triphosphate hydrolase domain-containing protein [Strongyloides ratti]